MTSSNAPRPSSMVGPDIACCYHGEEIMRRRLFDARVLYVMRVANVLRSIEAKPVLHDLIICKRDRSARPQGLADERASSLWPVWGVRPLTRGGGPPGAPPGPPLPVAWAGVVPIFSVLAPAAAVWGVDLWTRTAAGRELPELRPAAWRTIIHGR